MVCGWHYTESSSFILFFCLPLYIAFHSFVNIVDTSNTCSINIDAKKKKLNQIDNFLSMRTHVCYMCERATPDGVQTWSSGYFARVLMRKLIYIYFSISLGSFFNVTTGNTPHTLNLPVHSFLFHTLFLSSQLSRNARMLTSFPLLLSEVREKRGEVWEEGGSWRLLALLGLETFPFLLSACLASLCTFNNAFPVHTAAVVVVCRYFVSKQCLTILLFCFNYSILSHWYVLNVFPQVHD